MKKQKNYNNRPKIESHVRRVKDGKGRIWIVQETVIQKWYPREYFEAVLADESDPETKLAQDVVRRVAEHGSAPQPSAEEVGDFEPDPNEFGSYQEWMEACYKHWMKEKEVTMRPFIFK